MKIMRSLLKSLLGQRLSQSAGEIERQIRYRLNSYYRNFAFAKRPDTLYIEPTNICTANCVFCAYQFDQRPKKYADIQSVVNIVDQYVRVGGRSVNLTPFAGEIFVHPEIISLIKTIATRKQIKRISTYTNASLLHTVDINDFLYSGVTHLGISVAPLREDLYKAIYRAGFYSKVTHNIKSLLAAYVDNIDSTISEIEISFRADRSLSECIQLPDFQTTIKPYLHDKRIKVTALQDYDSWSATISQDDLLSGMRLLNTELSGQISTCRRIHNIQLLVDGTIRLCGCRFDNSAQFDELKIGNIDSIELVEAYNSPKAQQIRASFAEGRILGVCKKCSWYNH
jgi:hypothetical protein